MEKVVSIEEIPMENRKHNKTKFVVFSKIIIPETMERVETTVTQTNVLTNIKYEILEKHNIDKSHGALIKINSPLNDTSCLEIL